MVLPSNPAAEVATLFVCAAFKCGILRARAARGGIEMQRVTLSVDDDLLATLDRHMKKHRYASRSEAL
eukprot:gene664-858_t